MSGMLNKLKEAVTGQPAGEHNTTGTTGTGQYGATGGEQGIGGVSEGVESSRLTNMGPVGQLDSSNHPYKPGMGSTVGGGSLTRDLEAESGVGNTGYNDSSMTGTTGSTRRHERELEAGAGAAALAGAEHHHRHHGNNTTGSGLTSGGGATDIGGYDSGYTGSGNTTVLPREEVARRIEPHDHIAGDNIEEYTTPSSFSHGQHMGATSGIGGITGSGVGSGSTKRHERELEVGAGAAAIAGAEHHHHKHQGNDYASGTTTGYGADAAQSGRGVTGNTGSGMSGSNTGPTGAPAVDSTNIAGGRSFGEVNPGTTHGRSSGLVDISPENAATQGAGNVSGTGSRGL